MREVTEPASSASGETMRSFQRVAVFSPGRTEALITGAAGDDAEDGPRLALGVAEVKVRRLADDGADGLVVAKPTSTSSTSGWPATWRSWKAVTTSDGTSATRTEVRRMRAMAG